MQHNDESAMGPGVVQVELAAALDGLNRVDIPISVIIQAVRDSRDRDAE